MLSDNPASRILVLAIVLMMALVPFGANKQASADTIDTFSTGNAKETYTFTGSGVLDTITLRVPVDGVVTSATMDVTGQVDTGNDYPSNVKVFVGTLNGQVYQFSGPAVGKMGLQQTFNDGETSKTIVFLDGSTDDSIYVRLPRGADITSAQIRFKGDLQDAGWEAPVRFSQQQGQNSVPIDVGWRSSPQLIDWDDDGDLDLLSSAYMTNPIRYLAFYENTGTASSFTWSYDISDFNTIRASGGYYSVPTLFDLDDDGDHDMVFGEYNPGYLRLYWNTGSDASPTWLYNGSSQYNANSVFYGIREEYYADPDFADMDNDGDVDLACGRYASGGTSTVGVSSYRNDYNNGVYSWATHNFFGGISTDQMSSPCLFDFDDDGDYDMFVGYYNGTIGYYENTGSKIKPSWTPRMKVQGNIDVGIMSSPAVGDLDGDGDYDLVVGAQDGQFYYYENLLSYPINAKLDIGKDGDVEKHFVGEYKNTSVVSGFHDELESHLGVGRPAFRDQWGNEFDDILLSLSSESPGRMTVDSIRIAYTYTKTTLDFASILNNYITANKDKADSEGYLKVPVIVASNSKGKVELSNLKIVMDRAPKWSTVPSTFAIDEDTKNTKLIDILDYVLDDFTGTDKLTLEVIQVDKQGVVTVSLNEGHYVSVDAETGPDNDNWNGKVTIMLKATDGIGQSAESNQFTVEVRPVNDPPALKGGPPSTTLEDETFSYQIAAYDIDGDKLKYTINGMPAGMKLSETGMVTWLPTNDDVGMYSMTITVEDPYGLMASLNWSLEVINVNDPPTITLPGEITVTEGQSYPLDISKAITDVDNILSELNVMVENPYASLDMGKMVITLLYPKESGIDHDELLVIVTDPSGATVTAKIMIRVIRVEKLDLAGVPDQQAVEEDTWTLDIKPYLSRGDSLGKTRIHPAT